jgi:hypothetical protein
MARPPSAIRIRYQNIIDSLESVRASTRLTMAVVA